MKKFLSQKTSWPSAVVVASSAAAGASGEISPTLAVILGSIGLALVFQRQTLAKIHAAIGAKK